jgi:hypothetical protein
MAGRKKGRHVQMAGLFDWLDIFSPLPEQKRGADLPALPAPKSLPVVRKEERGIIERPTGRTLKEQVVSLFDIFGPPAKGVEDTRITAPVEAGREISPGFKEMMFPIHDEEGELPDIFEEVGEERPIRIQVPPERYEFIRVGPGEVKRIPYESGEWMFPSEGEMAEHLERIIDFDKVFEEVYESTFTDDYQDRLTESVGQGIPLYTPLFKIDDRNLYSDFAEFYGIPWALVEQVRSPDEFKAQFLNPLGFILTEVFEAKKTKPLGGFFSVAYNGQDGKYWLYYVEPWLGRLPD